MSNTTGATGIAIVTGASSGIGQAYAERLAARGYDLVLVARREERLRELASDLQSRFRIRAEALAADLSRSEGTSSVIARIEREERLTLLINNAGISALNPLTDTPDEVIDGVIALNVTATTALSKAALTAFKKRGSGTIVNIGSGAGVSPYPGIAVYSATKAFVHLLTRTLQSEVEGTNIRVQLVMPGAVKSEGWDRAIDSGKMSLPESLVMSTGDCVDAALAGLDRGELVTAPSLENESLLHSHESAASELLLGMFNGQAASRYALAN